MMMRRARRMGMGLAVVAATWIVHGRLGAQEPAGGGANSRPFNLDDPPANVPGARLAATVPDRPLVYTAQFLPLDEMGRVVGPNDAARQLDVVWKRLEETLAKAPRSRLVRLNVYAASDESAAVVRKELAPRLNAGARSAASLVVTPLPAAGALVALDAVAFVSEPEAVKAEGVQFVRAGDVTTAALSPAGRRIFISGQAEKGTDLASATRLTLESLARTLEFLKRDAKQDTVQVKAFLTPMRDADVVRREVRKFFGKRTPPLALVEWESTLPIEIELVAHGGEADTTAPVVEYVTPPGMSASPVFSRVAVINHGPTIFVSGLAAGAEGSAEAEVIDVFGQLERITRAAGSDLRHLVKGTYYVSADDVSGKFNELRPRYYDAKRPPAASKAAVGSVGVPGRGLLLDMIAVPAAKR